MSTSTTAAPVRRSAARAAGTELLLVALLYVGYSFARTLASHDRAAALARAIDLQRLEDRLGLADEHWWNAQAAAHAVLGVPADFWYASAHYVVTFATLLWLYRRGHDVYVPARRALTVATLVALAFYLTMPTAPPRTVDGFVDVMAQHADLGWWDTAASAPKGLGGLTDELAAFPSMHAGWALWVALVVWRSTPSRLWRAAGVLYAATTALVVVATGNHWVLDVVAGEAVVALAWLATTAPRERRTLPPTSATNGGVVRHTPSPDWTNRAAVITPAPLEMKGTSTT